MRHDMPPAHDPEAVDRMETDAAPPGGVHDAELNGERAPLDGRVRGERTVPFVSRSAPLQSRVSSVLAGGLTMVLGLSALTWYYANALTRPARARDAVQAAAARRAQGDMPLPSLGRIDPPLSTVAAGSGASAAAGAPSGGSHSGPEQVSSAGAAVAPGTGGAPVAGAAPVGGGLPTAAAAATAHPIDALTRTGPRRVPSAAMPPGGWKNLGTAAPPDRRLAGPVFVRQSAEAGANVGLQEDPVDSRNSPVSTPQAPADEHGLAGLLRPTPVAAVQARILPTRRFLLPKGSFIDCTLETAIDSTLPGMTTCVVATDTFSADGTVVLLERGTRLVGETRGEVQQGGSRLFVLWTEARTPTGVVVPLDSPGTDELGRSGLAGTVERHFWERFGSAILISAIDGAVQAAAQRSAGSGGTVIYNPSSSQDVLTEVLRSTVNIRPTVRKNQGDRIQVFVARDVDFRSVYELRR